MGFANARILTGPTASGKSALALAIAERIGGEIVAVDSMTLYRGMDIGTAKPTAEERARVPHHLIDVFDPWDSGTVAWWLRAAETACQEIAARGNVPLLVGGTPFYLKALLHGLFPGPPANPELRQRLEEEAANHGNTALHTKLAAVDPRTAARLHPNDVRRVVRALEVFELTGQPISSWQQTWDTAAFAGPAAAPPPARIPAVVLVRDRDELYARINRRVSAQIDAGWADEVCRLQHLPRPISREARQALGYREMLDHFAGNGSTWEETVDLIRTHTRQFARRQLVWFRHLTACVPVSAEATETTEQVLRAWEQCSV